MTAGGDEPLVASEATPRARGYGTFEGVFVPTLLTILGVIMYLRAGWVVGNAGLLGTWLIILLTFTITGATGLSMSSVTTNIRIGAGGAYSIISRSLGVEVGGSVAVPLYLSQTLAVTMYLFGFREGWLSIFPDHPALLVDLVTYAALLSVASVSARLAFRVQFLILALVIASLVSVLVAAVAGSVDEPIRWWGEFPGAPEKGFPGTSFWGVFAVFFPAGTGIMAGANLSGELEDPRRSVPLGTMAAIAVSLAVYLLMAYWLARVAAPDELAANYAIMVDRAAWGPAVIAGLLGATFSSALASIVGAPRVLRALATHRLFPGSARLARTTPRGEPRNAMGVTAAIVLGALMLRDLNTVAPLITMFFLITYAMINVVVLIEQSLGLVSFRPLLRIPRMVAFVGALGCIFAMFVVNAVFSLVAVIMVLVFYGVLVHRHVAAPYGDVRSGLFVAVAEWAAKKVSDLRGTQERAWKPNLLVPVEDDRELRGTFRLIHAIAYPKGSVRIMGIAAASSGELVPSRLERLCEAFRDEDVFASQAIVDASDYGTGVVTAMGALGGGFFRPNTLFLVLREDPQRVALLSEIVLRSRGYRMGVLLFAPHATTGLGRQHTINIWLRSPTLEPEGEAAETDLAILTAYKLRQNWQGRIRLLTAIPSIERKAEVQTDLERLLDIARLPDAEVYALEGDFASALHKAPPADIGILGLPTELDVGWVREVVAASRSSCLFVRGSGEESALA
ncbi:MAG: amino acid permease [Actinomycetota bacterium]|nr:amino acid permease [Actinomycetota bacterium]